MTDTPIPLDSTGQPLSLDVEYTTPGRRRPVKLATLHVDPDGDAVVIETNRYFGYVRPQRLTPVPPPPTFIDLLRDDRCDSVFYSAIHDERPDELRVDEGLVYRRVDQ